MAISFDEGLDLDEVLENLSDADAGVRRVAVMELRELDEDDAIPLAVKALSDSDANVRKEAAQVMDEFEGAETIQALVGALADSDEGVRTTAAAVLAETQDPTAGPILMQGVGSTNIFVKAASLHGLRGLRLAESEPLALENLEHAEPTVRRESVGVLAYLKSVSILPVLMNTAANDSDENVRRAATP